MKPEQLMDAIESIDDRYVEECAYGVRRRSHIPWGLISAAACFCLVIAGVVFARNAGLFPYATDPAGQPSAGTTSVVDSLEDPVPPTGITDGAISKIKAAFIKKYAQPESVISINPEDLSVRNYGHYSGSYAVFVDGVFGYTQALRKETVGGLTFRFYTGQPLLIYRDGQIEELPEAYDQAWLTDAELAELHRHFDPNNPTYPPVTPLETVPQDTVGPPSAGSQLSWYRWVLACEYDHPYGISLQKMFATGFPEESTKPTEEEWKLLQKVDGFREDQVLRLPMQRMSNFIKDTFGVPLSDLPGECFAELTYLEQTQCYYYPVVEEYDPKSVSIKDSDWVEGELVIAEYTQAGSENTYVVGMTYHNDSDFRILFNRKSTMEAEKLAGKQRHSFAKLLGDLIPGNQNGAGDFRILHMQTQTDSTMLVTYTVPTLEVPYQVHLKPDGDDWQFLSNRPAF